jgi:hypothetical protein
MHRKLIVSLVVAAACSIGSSVQAQTEQSTEAVSAKPNAQLAAYTQEYSSGCVNCSPGSSSGGYNYGGGSFGYPAAGGPQPMGPQGRAFGRSWGGAASNRDCSRFYHYPYVFYPQNFRGSEYYQSSDSLYYRYPPEMQIPVYNRQWHNYYPSPRRYHWGHHFLTDVF